MSNITTTTAPAVSAVRIITAHDSHTVETGLIAARRVADSGATVRDMVTEAKRLGVRGASKRPGAWLILADIEPLSWAPGVRTVYAWDVLVSAAAVVYQSAEASAAWAEALEDADDRDEALEALLEVATEARAKDAARKRSGSGTGKGKGKAKPAPVKPAPESRSVAAILADVLADLARVERRAGEVRAEDHATLVAIGAALETIAVNA